MTRARLLHSPVALSMRPVHATRGRTIAAALILLLAACSDQTAQVETTSPEASLDGEATARPTEKATPEPAPTSMLTPEPTPTPTLPDLGEAGVLVSVTSNLVVRSAPEVSDQSQIYDVQLGPGDLLWVQEGPVEGSGYRWYRGQVPSPQTPDGWLTGWVAAADKDGTPWLAGVQPEGEWWRLLGEGTEGIAHTVAVATDQAALEQVWADAGAEGSPPQVSFEDEVVVRYTHAVSGTCPEITLHGLGLDEGEQIVYTVATSPIDSPAYDGPACTTDARPHAFIVAVERDRLPSGEVHFRLERGFIACPDCGRDSEQVTIVFP